MSAVEVVVLIVSNVIVAAFGYGTGQRVGYLRGRRDERLEWQPPTPAREIH
jgi:hypothetical protein